jgi:hypothetical protein
MFKVTVSDIDGDEAVYENVQGFHYPAGILHIDFQDGSAVAYAPGQWLELISEDMGNPQTGDLQL